MLQTRKKWKINFHLCSSNGKLGILRRKKDHCLVAPWLGCCLSIELQFFGLKVNHIQEGWKDRRTDGSTESHTLSNSLCLTTAFPSTRSKIKHQEIVCK